MILANFDLVPMGLKNYNQKCLRKYQTRNHNSKNTEKMKKRERFTSSSTLRLNHRTRELLMYTDNHHPPASAQYVGQTASLCLAPAPAIRMQPRPRPRPRCGELHRVRASIPRSCNTDQALAVPSQTLETVLLIILTISLLSPITICVRTSRGTV